MSRSFKKNLILKDSSGNSYRKWAKRQANKKVRKTKKVANGKQYRKVFETWDINDYVCHWDSSMKNFWPKYKAKMK